MLLLQNSIKAITKWDRNIRMFFLSNLLYQTGNGLFSVLYNLYVQALGFPQELNGRIISVQSLATALMFIPVGLLSDRVSRKSVLIAGCVGTGAAFIARALTEGVLSLQLIALFAGLFASVSQVIAVPFLTDYSKKDERLKLLSYHFSATLAAQVFGSLGGGALTDLLQFLGCGKVTSLQIALAVGGVSMFISFLPLMLVKDKPAPSLKPEHAEIMPESERLTPTPAAEWKTIGIFISAQLLVGFGSGLVIPYLNLYFTDRFSVSVTAVGLLISLGQVMTIVSMLIGPTLVSRVGQVRAIALFQLLSLPFLLITGFTTSLLVASVGYLFRQALMNAANPIQSAILVDRVSGSRLGIANSLNQTVFMLGWAAMGNVQPLLLSSFGTYKGYAVTFSLTGGLYVVAALFFYFMFRKAPSRQAALQAGQGT